MAGRRGPNLSRSPCRLRQDFLRVSPPLRFRGNRRSVPDEASELPRTVRRPSPDHDIARVQALLPHLLFVCAHDAPRSSVERPVSGHDNFIARTPDVRDERSPFEKFLVRRPDRTASLPTVGGAPLWLIHTTSSATEATKLSASAALNALNRSSRLRLIASTSPPTRSPFASPRGTT